MLNKFIFKKTHLIKNYLVSHHRRVGDFNTQGNNADQEK